MNPKNISIIVLIAGLILAALSILADSLGLTTNTTFGYKQIAGLLVGAILLVAGIILLRRAR